MDSNIKNKNGKPLFTFAKSFAGSATVGLGFLFVLSCATKSSLAPTPALMKSVGTMGQVFLQLTQNGINHSPSYSDDGQHFLFISRQRPSHAQTQIYEFNIANQSEKRISYQDGEIGSPIYSGPKLLAYNSTTDEIKERPARILKRATEPAPLVPANIPSEIYLSDRNSDNIIRLTQHPGFDGISSFKKSFPQKLFFARRNLDAFEFWEIQLPNNKERLLFSRRQTELSHLHWLENDNSWIWIQKEYDSNKSFIITADKAMKVFKKLALPIGLYTHFEISDSEKTMILSADLDASGKTQIYAYNFQSKCLGIIISHPTSLDQPSLSPNEKNLLFVSSLSGSAQIYQANVDLSQIKCLPPGP